MEYHENETNFAKMAKNRTQIAKFHHQCSSKGLDTVGEGWRQWFDAANEFAKIDYDYMHGVKINIDVLQKSYNIKLPDNITVVNRFIKLIRIINE